MNEPQTPREAGTNQSTTVASGPRLDPVQLVHLTDLHYGLGFNRALWADVQTIVSGLRADVIFVTGDLVNSPYWWRFHTARKIIDALRDAATASGRSPRLYVIAGNHDTRILGILPIVWITPLALGISALAAIAIYMLGCPHALQWIALAAIIALAYRYLLLRKFTSYFSDLIPALPTTLNELNLILYPFDSATRAISGAGGAILAQQFVDSRKPTSPTNEAPFRLAVVHHHSVPIPYDSKQETLMVLTNAGTFLSEVAKQGVRLILSGHKHHQHFSRIAINAETENEMELAVLNTGTPTAGRHPSPFGYNFSVIDLHAVSGAQITQYRSNGDGGFDKMPPFWAEGVEQILKALLRENTIRRNYRCDSIKITVDIGPDGDAVRTNEVAGFSYLGTAPIRKLPLQVRASLGTGQIERLRVTPKSVGAPVNIQVDYITRERRNQVCEIGLSHSIAKDHSPFDYSYQYHAINGHAMSAQQFRYMYPNTKEDPIEYAEWTLQQLPAAEATLQVNLPRDFAIVGKPWLSVMRGDREEPRLQSFYRANFSFDAVTNSVSVRLPRAPLGLRFRIQWRLTDSPPPAGGVAQSVEGEAAEAGRRLVVLAKTNPQRNPLSLKLLAGIEEQVRVQFNLEPPKKDPLMINLMVFDQQTKRLCIAAANYPVDDDRWKVGLEYGDGIAGRAFKTNGVSLFIKAKAVQNQTPFYYVPVSGAALSENGEEIEESAVLSVPLSHPPLGPIFGILNISSHKSYSRLVDITDDGVMTEFRRAVSEACFDAIMALHSPDV